jgi:hypothetical protein
VSTNPRDEKQAPVRWGRRTYQPPALVPDLKGPKFPVAGCILSGSVDVVPYVSVAKRSPILGYNHNVRYRGLVFHVQTEDSGVQAPHVFTHMFHGGVILSTRKLVYDAGSSEDVIRSLMQAQHKAALKELRRGTFDAKIDEYLGSNPELLPRDSSPEITIEEAPGDDEKIEDKREPILPLHAEILNEIAAIPPLASPPIPRPKTGPFPPIITFRPEGSTETHPTRDARPIAAAERSDSEHIASMGAASLPPLPLPLLPTRGGTTPRIAIPGPPRPAITPPVVVARDLTEQSSGGNFTIVPDSSEIYSPPPLSAEPPPGIVGDHPGAYSVRRRDASVEATAAQRRLPRPDSSSEGSTSRVLPSRGLSREPEPASAAPRGLASRPQPPPVPPVPMAPSTALPVTALSPGAALPVVSPTAVPAVPLVAPVRAPIAPTTPRTRPTGGVVMSRPAVIVGSPRATSPPNRLRTPTDDDRRGLGQGLISEKSLDEVILAYLSEDASEE